jgi:Cys-tRNA(Pro)/Cys-tRNA(Cys) deacylase
VNEDTPALVELAGTDLTYEVARFPPPRDVAASAQAQGIPPSSIAKSIVVRRGAADFVFVLVPGDRVIDWPKLRRLLGVSRLSLPDRADAQSATGYEPGAITPFGSTRRWPVVSDTRVAALDVVSIGAGARGVTVHLSGPALVRYLGATIADVTREI